LICLSPRQHFGHFFCDSAKIFGESGQNTPKKSAPRAKSAQTGGHAAYSF
jgi:hypothetical protein